jgi:hypothetical protein
MLKSKWFPAACFGVEVVAVVVVVVEGEGGLACRLAGKD